MKIIRLNLGMLCSIYNLILTLLKLILSHFKPYNATQNNFLYISLLFLIMDYNKENIPYGVSNKNLLKINSTNKYVKLLFLLLILI